MRSGVGVAGVQTPSHQRPGKTLPYQSGLFIYLFIIITIDILAGHNYLGIFCEWATGCVASWQKFRNKKTRKIRKVKWSFKNCWPHVRQFCSN
jgi:hypothetical protein